MPHTEMSSTSCRAIRSGPYRAISVAKRWARRKEISRDLLERLIRCGNELIRGLCRYHRRQISANIQGFASTP